MIGILQTKLRLFIRKPWLFIIMTAVCLLFSFFMGVEGGGKMTVPVYSELPEDTLTPLLEELNRSEAFMFESVDEITMKAMIVDGKADAGLRIFPENFKLVITSRSANVLVLQKYIQTVYEKKLRKDQLLSSVATEEDKERAEQVWNQSLAEPLFSIQTENFRNRESKVIDNQLQGIFGYSLFFVMFTIAFNVLSILEEKKSGIWDRMIVSGVSKWEMYVGNLLYSFMMGYIQVFLIFMTFRYAAGVEFYGGFGKTLIVLIPYVLAIVAFSLLLASLAKSIQHFNALVPLLSVSIAMLGGAYWPIEIVSAKLMIVLGKCTPLFYGMEALKGATIYQYGYAELLQPISILLVMAVLMMGIGINVFEKKR